MSDNKKGSSFLSLMFGVILLVIGLIWGSHLVVKHVTLPEVSDQTVFQMVLMLAFVAVIWRVLFKVVLPIVDKNRREREADKLVKESRNPMPPPC